MSYLRRKAWSPYVAGAGIGILSWFAFASASHPLGISGAFERSAAAAVANFNTDAAYFRLEGTPMLGWEWALVIGVFLGALLSSTLAADWGHNPVPAFWRARFGSSPVKRYALAFAGAGLMMIGARIAGGCTSGHGISGTLQLALSSWVFLFAIFASGAAAAGLIYGREGRKHV